MAVQEHFEGFDAEPEEISRSAHKREAQEIRSFTEKIANLGDLSFSRLSFPDDSVKEAIMVARGLKRNSDERRRQLQYAAKLMRLYELDDLRAQVAGLGAPAKTDPQAKRLEDLREEVIAVGMKAVNALCALIPDTDRNKLRTLVKKAQEEAAKDLPGEKPAARALYKHLKEEFARSGVEIPAALKID